MKKITIIFLLYCGLINSQTGVNIQDQWKIKGNSITTNTNFIGTTSNRSFNIYTNNTKRLKVDSNGIVSVTNTLSIGNSTYNLGAIFNIANSSGNSYASIAAKTSTSQSYLQFEADNIGGYTNIGHIGSAVNNGANTLYRDSSGFIQTASKRLVINNGLSGGIIVFGTDGYTAAAERLRLDLGGAKVTGSLNVTSNAQITGSANVTSSLVAKTFSTGASTGAAGSAPLYISAGTLMATPEVNAIANDGNFLYFTNNTTTRQTVQLNQLSITTNSFNSTSTSIANITSLTSSLTAGRTYKFIAELFVDADAIGGSKYTVDGGATASAIIYEVILVDNTSSANTITSRRTSLGSTIGQSGTTSGFVRISGIIVCNGSGTFSPKFAQNSASGTSSVLGGSNFMVTQIN